MRILGYEVRRFAKTDVDYGIRGAETPDWMRDFLAGGPDVNPQLTGRAKYEVYQEMRLADSAVRSALWMTKFPIRGGKWDCVPPQGRDEPVDRLIADACAKLLGLRDQDPWLDLTWNRNLSQQLLVLDWGAMLEEIVWPKDLVEWRDANGDEHLLRPIARLAPRAPATIDSIRTDPATGRIREVKQWLPGTSPIPGEKIVHVALEGDAGNPYGISLLRPMWGPWVLKKQLMIASGIGWDRHAAGIPWIRHPDNAAAKARASQIGRDLRQHERAYVTLEGPPPAQGVDGWDVGLLNGAMTLADPVDLLAFFNRAIGEAALQQFSALGTTARGARAVGEVLADPYYTAVETFARDIAEERARQVLRPFIDHNFGTEFETPRLVVSKLKQLDVTILAQALADLANAGFNFADLDVQNDVRSKYDLPLLLPDDVGVEKTPPPTVPPREGDPLPTGEPGGEA